ncbi:MAG: M48 family metallopeptidase [Nitrococcus sp.]|nr:M48 family metallopeptidase [Nitrococcus sp.]
MSTEHLHLQVNGIPVEVRRKAIKNLHIGVYPPDGRVRVAAPARMDDETIRLAIVSRLAWIRRHQRRFLAQVRESARELVTGESHYYRGQRYRLDVVDAAGRAGVHLTGMSTMELGVPPGTDTAGRRCVLERWYRRELRALVPDLLATWEPIIGKSVAEWRIKRMKTRWGSCNIGARRIWLNLELIRKPHACLEYVLVHEMAHLLERHHTHRFRDLMDRFLPDWRLRRDELNKGPLAHEDWG